MTAIDTDVVAVQRMFDINVFGPMRMVRHFHDMIIGAKGAIVNIGSIGGVIPYLYGCEYLQSRGKFRSLNFEKHHTMPPRQPWHTGVIHSALRCHLLSM
jgi:short-subunit dehydrogenase